MKNCILLAGALLFAATSGCPRDTTTTVPQSPPQPVVSNATEVMRLIPPGSGANIYVYSFEYEGHKYLVVPDGMLLPIPSPTPTLAKPETEPEHHE